MPDRTTPEELLDQWLDALNEPARAAPPPIPGEIDALASVALEYRRTLGGAPTTPTARPERNGKMLHAQPVDAANGVTWEIVARPGPSRRGWSSWLATAVMVALLVGLAGGTYIRQFGVPGGPGTSEGPSQMAGITASPEATPAGSLSCGSPGYRPVVEGDVNEDALAAIGVTGEPIVVGDGEVIVPQADGGTSSVPRGDVVTFDPGTIVTRYEDGSSTVTRLSDGEMWDFPAVKSRRSDSGTIAGNGRYYVAPLDDTLTNWYVLDTQTGERTTTADTLGEPFDGPTNPSSGERFLGQPRSSDDLSTFVLSFSEIIDGSDGPAFSGTSPGTLVIPGSIADAYFDDFSPETTVSPGGKYLASSTTIIDARTGEPFFGVDTDDFRGYLDGPFIAFMDDAPTILAWADDEVRSIHPVIGGYDVVFEADGPIQTVGYDATTSSLVVGAGQPDLENWTWLDLDTGRAVPLPELTGYKLNRVSPVTSIGAVRHLTGVADFIQAEGSTRPSHSIDITEYAVRAIDMETSMVSDPITNRTPEGREFSGAYLPTFVEDGFVATENPAGDVSVLQPGSKTRFTIPKPANVDHSSEDYYPITGTPSGQCLMLNVYRYDATSDEFDWTHDTYIAPMEPGSTWMELDVRVASWVEIPDEAEPHTLPAQDFATPAEPVESRGSIIPSSVEKTIQVDIDGVLAGDEDAEAAARQEIIAAYGPYDAEGCRAGFVLTSARAPSIGEGVELSRTTNALLKGTMPDVFGDVESEAVALPHTTPDGEVQMHVFFYKGCSMLDGTGQPLPAPNPATPVDTPHAFSAGSTSPA